jgi:integrase
VPLMAPAPRPRTRGAIDLLPSGAYRVRVYAGTDPVTGKRHDLVEVVPPGPKAAAEAEKVRTRLLSQLDERRNPHTKATVNQLLDRYLEVVDLDESTRNTYVGYLDRHVRPILGNLLLSKVDGEMLDTRYGQLRRCRARCSGRSRAIEHPEGGRARVRRAVPSARLPTDGCVVGAPDPLDLVRRDGTRSPVALDRR